METPTYAVVKIDFLNGATPITRNIDTVVAVCPSSNNAGPNLLCGIRDYEIQILVPTTQTPDGVWQRVKSVAGNTTEWVLYAHLPAPVMAKAVRLLIKDINNTCFYDDKQPLFSFAHPGAYGDATLNPADASSLRAALYELEAYGPATQ